MAEVRYVLFYVPLRPGNLILAEMDDGTLCIIRDDRETEACWPHGQMADAVAAFKKLKLELTGKADGQQP